MMDTEDNQLAQNDSVSVSSTSSEVVRATAGDLRRTSLIITNTSAVAIVWISKGPQAAVPGKGYRLAPGGALIEGNDGGYTCWQGQVQAVSDINGSVALAITYSRRV